MDVGHRCRVGADPVIGDDVGAAIDRVLIPTIEVVGVGLGHGRLRPLGDVNWRTDAVDHEGEINVLAIQRVHRRIGQLLPCVAVVGLGRGYPGSGIHPVGGAGLPAKESLHTYLAGTEPARPASKWPARWCCPVG